MTQAEWVEDADLLKLLLREPVMLIGRRRGKAIETRVVNLHEDTFDPIRAIAAEASASLAAMKSRAYEPAAELEVREEYFALPIDDIRSAPTSPVELQQPDGSVVQIEDPFSPPPPTDQFFNSLGAIGALETLDAEQLKTSTFLFYAIAFEDKERRVIFFRKQDPTVALRRGLAAFSYGDALRRVAKPDIVLDRDIDFVIDNDHVFMIHKTAFELIVSNLRVALQDVPAAAAELSSVLAKSVPLLETSLAALQTMCGRRLSLAVRLRGLAARVKDANIDAPKVRASMKVHGEDPTLLVNATGSFEFGEAQVPMFLDVIEGRFFEDDFTGEKRRADRLSKRQSS